MDFRRRAGGTNHLESLVAVEGVWRLVDSYDAALARGAPDAELMAIEQRIVNEVRRLRGTLAAAADRGPVDFVDLLLTPGVGARTVEALAHVAEVVHGAPCRFRDPARFSYAHGGKDGHPFPVPLRVYDQTIRVLKDAVGRAKLGNDDRLAGLRELDRQARALECTDPGGPSLEDLFARERRLAARHGGRTVFDDRPVRGGVRRQPRFSA